MIRMFTCALSFLLANGLSAPAPAIGNGKKAPRETKPSSVLAADYTRYPVPRDLLDSFRADGHVVLRGLASHIEREGYEPAKALSGGAAPAGKTVIVNHLISATDDRIRRLICSPRLSAVAADLLGVPAVRLFSAMRLTKAAKRGETGIHLDAWRWPFEPHRALTLWLPLTEVSKSMGTLRFVSGSYLDHLVREQYATLRREYLQATYGNLLSNPVKKLMVGDATAHHGLTVHSAAPNHSSRDRVALALSYYAEGTLVSAGEEHKGRIERYFPGVKPGEAAVGPDTPLVFDARPGGRDEEWVFEQAQSE